MLPIRIRAFCTSTALWMCIARISGKGTPVLLLQDAQSSLQTWDGWTRELSKRSRVISVDPGSGWRCPPDGQLRAVVREFSRQPGGQTGFEKIHLAGNGLGAQIAWFYAADHPERLDRLVLLDAPGFLSPKTHPGLSGWPDTVLNEVMLQDHAPFVYPG
ncbi:MAG: alpha/beta hydrolase [Lewinellaceae bacterium]|nr:alpha/beta hydrolase [Lewinellaceae bacterium]